MRVGFKPLPQIATDGHRSGCDKDRALNGAAWFYQGK
jgi:hypothetical protein